VHGVGATMKASPASHPASERRHGVRYARGRAAASASSRQRRRASFLRSRAHVVPMHRMQRLRPSGTSAGRPFRARDQRRRGLLVSEAKQAPRPSRPRHARNLSSPPGFVLDHEARQSLPPAGVRLAPAPAPELFVGGVLWDAAIARRLENLRPTGTTSGPGSVGADSRLGFRLWRARRCLQPERTL
jgi:hypothetical protein